MSTARRAARGRESTPATTGDSIPADLAAGPCVETWGAHPDDLFGAWQLWKDARDAWAQAHGIDPRSDYRHLPPELHDRAPFRLSDLAQSAPPVPVRKAPRNPRRSTTR